MKISKLILGVVLCFNLASSSFAAVETVTLLDRGEPNEALVFHADHLWVGHSRTNFNADYKLKVFDRKDSLVKELPLNHSVQYLYAYGPDSVIAVGTGHSPNLTMYTIATRKGVAITAKTTTIPARAWANRWLGNIGGKNYFSDPGGNNDDKEASENPNLPAQTLFRMDNGGPRYLTTRLRLPIGGLAIDGKLFVLQKDGIETPRSNLAVVSPNGGTATLAFSKPRNNMAGMARLSNGLLAISERNAGQLILLDSKTLKIVAELPTAAEPRGVASLGKCAVVGSMAERSVKVFRPVNGTYEVAAELPMDLSQNEFAMLFQIAVDETTGRIYGRSNLPCNPMIESCSADRNRVVSWKADAARILAACSG